MAKNIVSLEKIAKSYAEKVICYESSFGIHEKDKIGLFGINGCGKSTFLKMLVGKEPLDSGAITFRNGLKIGYLPQQPVLDPEKNIYEQIYYSNNPKYDLLRKYHKLSEELRKEPDSKELQDAQQKLFLSIEASDGWEIENRAKKFLNIFGFEDLTINTGILSGGQKRRIDLARVLMDDPDLLIMDEPTNHLDVDIIEWLQQYLLDFKGSLIFVTHDRYFLDAISNRIMEMENGNIRFYEGNYSFYLQRKEIEQQEMINKENRRQAQLKKEMRWLQRGARARTSKPKNHLDRVKELIDKSYLVSNADLDISFQTKRLGKTILEIKNASKGYDQKMLFSSFSHNFQKMERIGIIGANGCGKTTLLRLITKEELPDQGKVKTGLNTKFAYFKQNADTFDPEMKVVDYIRSYAENIRTKDGVLHSATEMLEKFLFDGKLQQSKLKSLSGGEKKRLFLLSSLMFGANFIILDEPTNDLDIKTLEILEDYLDAFEGCILTVSHDRYFLDRVIDYLFVFTEDGIIKFPGNYSDYLLVKRFKEEKINEETKKPRKKENTSVQKIGYMQKRELTQIEKDMAELEKGLKSLEQQIIDNASEMTPNDFKVNTESQEKIKTELEVLENRWLEIQDT